jgi:hypothetical protein
LALVYSLIIGISGKSELEASLFGIDVRAMEVALLLSFGRAERLVAVSTIVRVDCHDREATSGGRAEGAD